MATAASGEAAASYVVGVMTMQIEERGETDTSGLHELAVRAAERLQDALKEDGRLNVRSFAFRGPHLTPVAGAYGPMGFLEVGLAEKIERGVHFLLVVTEVDLAASQLSYTLALPSRLTNVGILSTKRLEPSFWGEPADGSITETRLSALMLHILGQLLGLELSTDPTDPMHRVTRPEALERRRTFSQSQIAAIRRSLPIEGRHRSAEKGRLVFASRTVLKRSGSILNAVLRASPVRLLSRMPTMLAAALSVIIVLLFSAEVWDVASTVSTLQVASFAVLSISTATFVLYRGFALGALLDRDRRLTEDVVVTTAATLLSLLATLLVMFALLGAVMYFGIVAVFPKPLMDSWPTVGAATALTDHLKLSAFLAAFGVLAGSLGGRSDGRDVVRAVLFMDDET
jgi:hypothetical protein